MKSKRLLLVILFVSLFDWVQAQPTYEIRAVNKGNGFIGVEMRITAGTPPATANSLTDLVFGIKWQSSYNVELVSTITTNYGIVKSDVRKQKNNFYYQAFSAANTPFLFPATWTVKEWIELMSIRNTLSGTGFGTFEIAETGFDVTTDPNFSINLIDYTPIVVGSATNVPLPVNMAAFEASPANRSIHILWSTTTEQNSNGFEVQRAASADGDFTKIAWIDSRGNGAGNQYDFFDKAVVAKVTYYYRLKQVDRNEKYAYSGVRTAMLNEVYNKGIRIMPNPADKMLQVVFDGTMERGTVVIKVVDAKGSVVSLQSHYIDVNANARLNVSALANGQYVLVIEKNKEVLYTKSFQKN